MPSLVLRSGIRNLGNRPGARRRPFAATLLCVVPVLALLAAPTAGQTPYQRYLCLDGVNDYASVADNPSLDLGSGATDDFTIETFFYVPDLTNTTTDTLIWKQGSFGLYVIFRAATPDRFIYRIYTGPGSTDYVYLFADVNLGVGWHHVAAIWDNEATPSWDYLALYVDGALVASSSGLEMTPGILNTTSPLYVAAYAGVNPAIGGFEETRLSSAVRYSGPTYTVPTAPFVSDESTRALWHFDDAPGSTTFSDSSGQGNTLAGSGGAQTCGEACPTIELSPATLPNGVQGAAYSQSLAASGGTGPYGFAVTLGALPPGVTLSSGGLVSGTPTVPGTYGFTVTATDANGCTGARAYTLVVDCSAIGLSPATLPNGVQGAAYSQSLAASGGTGPYGFAVTLGALPPGVTLSSGGLVSGTPTVPGTYGFTVTATDANGCTGAHSYTLVVDCPAIGLSPATLPNGVQGAAYSQSLTASGGTEPYGFAVTLGALPPGVTLSSGGLVSGTPSAPGSYGFTVTAADANGCTGARAYTLSIVLEADLSLTLSDSPDPVTGTSPLTYTVAVTNTGPNTASTLVVSHTLPAGVAFNSAGGPGWTCGETGGVVTCDRSSLAVGTAPDITVQVTPGPTGALLVSSASVSAVETDPNPANNSHSVTTTVTGVPYADLGILKTGPTDPVLWGWPVAYVISVTNSGPDTVAGATVTDAFPAAVLAVSWTCAGTGGSFCAASGTGDIDDSTVNLTPGGSVTYTATGVLAWGTMLPVSNTATVSSPIYDPFAANNTSTTSTSVDPDLIFKDGFQ